MGHLLKIKRSLDHRHTQQSVSILDHHKCEHAPRRKGATLTHSGERSKGEAVAITSSQEPWKPLCNVGFPENLFRGHFSPWEFGTKRAREWNRANNNGMAAIVPNSEMELYFFNGSFLGCHFVGIFVDVNYGINVDGDDHIYFFCHQHLIAKSK